MTKKYILVRKYREDEATLGTLFDEKQNEICKTLENPWLDNKQGISCIPEGTYTVKRDLTGRYQYWKVLGVPDREHIEIHNGNTSKDTRGCIIFGKTWFFLNDKLGVSNSRDTLKRLLKELPNEWVLQIV